MNSLAIRVGDIDGNIPSLSDHEDVQNVMMYIGDRRVERDMLEDLWFESKLNGLLFQEAKEIAQHVAQYIAAASMSREGLVINPERFARRHVHDWLCGYGKTDFNTRKAELFMAVLDETTWVLNNNNEKETYNTEEEDEDGMPYPKHSNLPYPYLEAQGIEALLFWFDWSVKQEEVFSVLELRLLKLRAKVPGLEHATITYDIGDSPLFNSPRRYASTTGDGGNTCHVRFPPRIVDLPADQVDAVIRHELGHVVDFIVPYMELEEWAQAQGCHDLPSTPERKADVLAELIWGQRIYYDERLVQTFNPTGISPRPEHLGL